MVWLPSILVALASSATPQPRVVEGFAGGQARLRIPSCEDGEPLFAAAEPNLTVSGNEGFDEIAVERAKDVVVVVQSRTEVSCLAATRLRREALPSGPLKIFVASRSFRTNAPFRLALQSKRSRAKMTDGGIALDRGEITYLDHGVRAEANPVVRLVRDGRGLVCTGTWLVVGDEAGILTAAHCLYQMNDDRLGPLLDNLRTERGARLNLTQARVPRAFVECARRRARFADCVADEAPDIAFIPDEGSRPEAWSACRGEPGDNRVVVLGYGLNVNALPESLLMGEFLMQPPLNGSASWTAQGQRRVMVNHGDSGGPVLLEIAWEARDASRPSVCWVVSAYEDNGGGRLAHVTAAWNLESLLDDSP